METSRSVPATFSAGKQGDCVRIEVHPAHVPERREK